MKNIAVLGSTGSVGIQAIDVLRHNRDIFKVVGLSTNKNIDLLYKQVMEFSPQVAAVADMDRAFRLKKMLQGSGTEVLGGAEGLTAIASWGSVHTVLVAVVGIAGLMPTINAIRSNKIIALANKETLVAGGEVVYKEMEKSNSIIVPVDSEHSAIFQCLKSGDESCEVESILLTASGGPFRGKTKDQLKDITPEQALKHPNWNMGRKISIDSATLMNKGLEVIECHWLFKTDYDRIKVLVHPQSIVHSMVEYIDGTVIAQLGTADMRNPVLYALAYPKRLPGISRKLDLAEIGRLTFENPDEKTFKSLSLAFYAGAEGGTMPVVLNSANEAAVDLYLKGRIKFLDIPDIVERSMMNHININNPTIDDIFEIDNITRTKVYMDFSVYS